MPEHVFYWVYSLSKVSKKDSMVGPFKTIYETLNWIDDNRSEAEWENVQIKFEYKTQENL